MEQSEREKMISGEKYYSMDMELIADRKQAKGLTRLYNLASEDEQERRQEVLQELFGDIKGNICVESPFQCAYGYNIFMGDNVFMNFDCVILDCGPVVIGNNVMIGPKVQIYTAQHPLEAEIRNTYLEWTSPVTIKDNVWIGGGVILCPGVTIGANAVIGAGSVVVKDVPADVVVAGNPARIIRHL